MTLLRGKSSTKILYWIRKLHFWLKKHWAKERKSCWSISKQTTVKRKIWQFQSNRFRSVSVYRQTTWPRSLVIESQDSFDFQKRWQLMMPCCKLMISSPFRLIAQRESKLKNHKITSISCYFDNQVISYSISICSWVFVGLEFQSRKQEKLTGLL